MQYSAVPFCYWRSKRNEYLLPSTSYWSQILKGSLLTDYNYIIATQSSWRITWGLRIVTVTIPLLDSTKVVNIVTTSSLTVNIFYRLSLDVMCPWSMLLIRCLPYASYETSRYVFTLLYFIQVSQSERGVCPQPNEPPLATGLKWLHNYRWTVLDPPHPTCAGTAW